ncbi:MAG: hypothetical protein A2653_01095 [Candidatus Zambryskibacteria bacterium RIFCSPHIGHO2_01_FULL_43_25]|nr:MAG: hypothetical protein A2653_01095 [Candidatus Zambryskibacteria bacterium RIFCSPHIGHO2_01_FULL_43_25]OHB00296.1 MAG: hypothetical protein A3E94_02720 [Candidatus Zambryskibacteria bacterium RIFCSPHIGHO2_12_FULL_44_12b]
MKKYIWVVIIVVLAVGVYWVAKNDNAIDLVADFESCAAKGNPIMESYPRQCRTKDGKVFVEDIGNELEKVDLIRVSDPRPNQKIGNPVTVSGEARGYWYFEASFPIQVVDSKGNVLGTGIAQAQNDWMTEEFVPFKVEVEFSAPDTSEGKLLLKKDNPSGLPENDDQLVIPVKF